MDAQRRIEKRPIQNHADILLDADCRGAFAITRQAARSDHSPEMFRFHQETSLIRQCVSDTMMLMAGMNHNIRTIQSVSFGIVIEERTASGENIPRVINVKIHQT